MAITVKMERATPTSLASPFLDNVHYVLRKHTKISRQGLQSAGTGLIVAKIHSSIFVK